MAQHGLDPDPGRCDQAQKRSAQIHEEYARRFGPRPEEAESQANKQPVLKRVIAQLHRRAGPAADPDNTAPCGVVAAPPAIPMPRGEDADDRPYQYAPYGDRGIRQRGRQIADRRAKRGIDEGARSEPMNAPTAICHNGTPNAPNAVGGQRVGDPERSAGRRPPTIPPRSIGVEQSARSVPSSARALSRPARLPEAELVIVAVPTVAPQRHERAEHGSERRPLPRRGGGRARRSRRARPTPRRRSRAPAGPVAATVRLTSSTSTTRVTATRWSEPEQEGGEHREPHDVAPAGRRGGFVTGGHADRDPAVRDLAASG